MSDVETFIQILEASVKKNGEMPLTNKHLLNILRMCERILEQESNNEMMYMDTHGDWK